ncbi:Tumor necrosis factor receptor superfamily member 14, partial [Galemys pyrenaicus]
TLLLVLLGSLPCALSEARCKEEEYQVGAECCPKCNPGYRVQQACGEYMGTICVPCTPGTFTAHLNGLTQCLPCRGCDPALGLETRRGCQTTGDTQCGCAPGHVCVEAAGDSCMQCRPHATCSPGQRVRQRGSERQDTLCEDCPPGTFSPDGTLEQCQPHVACSPGQRVRQRDAAEAALRGQGVPDRARQGPSEPPPHQDPMDSRALLIPALLLGLLLLLHLSGLTFNPCREDKYWVWGACCPKCGPALGLETRRGCQTTGDTQCGCAPGHVCVEAAGDSCMQCRPHATCSPGQRVRQRGSERQDTLCEDCPPGTFSPDGTLEQCQPHVACSPGQRVRQRAAPRLAGNERQDTLCEDCPPGTFSPNGTLEQCQPWTRCSGLEKEASPGTGSSDVTCSSQALYLMLLLPCLGVPLALGGRWIWRNCEHPGKGTKRGRHGQGTPARCGSPGLAAALHRDGQVRAERVQTRGAARGGSPSAVPGPGWDRDRHPGARLSLLPAQPWAWRPGAGARPRGTPSAAAPPATSAWRRPGTAACSAGPTRPAAPASGSGREVSGAPAPALTARPRGDTPAPRPGPLPRQLSRLAGSERQDTLCEDCPPGTFSPDGTLEQCQPHVACSPGQRVRQRAAPRLAGNERQDTLCEDCSPGTFSPDGTLEQCQPWTRWEARPSLCLGAPGGSRDRAHPERETPLMAILCPRPVPALSSALPCSPPAAPRGDVWVRQAGSPQVPHLFLFLPSRAQDGAQGPLMRTHGSEGAPAAAHAPQARPAVTTEAEEESAALRPGGAALLVQAQTLQTLQTLLGLGPPPAPCTPLIEQRGPIGAWGPLGPETPPLPRGLGQEREAAPEGQGLDPASDAAVLRDWRAEDGPGGPGCRGLT